MKLRRIFQCGLMLLFSVLCYGCGLATDPATSSNGAYGAPTSPPVAAVPTNADASFPTAPVAARATMTPVMLGDSAAEQATMTPVMLGDTTGNQTNTEPTPRRRGTSTRPRPTADDQDSATSDTSDSSNTSGDDSSSAQPISGFKTVSAASLSKEARQTLTLIDQGGPFPYRRDGIVFQNREGILPREPDGYYHEYTVITPGEQDRGARRIIAGSHGERFYTQDHYSSFVQVLP